jgi:IS1 family transposase
MVSMNKLTIQKQVQVLGALVEGNSIRSTVRMTGAAKNTIVKLLCDVGRACEQYQNKVMVNLPCKRIEVDEIWSFCYAKQKNVPEKYQGKFGYGTIWTWVALDPNTKLVPVWLVASRGRYWAKRFVADIAWRMANRVQITTDAYRHYYEAVDKAFHGKVDYSQLMKVYGTDKDKEKNQEKRYSPSKLLQVKRRDLIGRPVDCYVSTSMVERSNLTLRMQSRRFTRLTNAFSKKVENLKHAVALHFMYYNFCRIHQALRITPAMAAGISTHLWEIEDILSLLNK